MLQVLHLTCHSVDVDDTNYLNANGWTNSLYHIDKVQSFAFVSFGDHNQPGHERNLYKQLKPTMLMSLLAANRSNDMFLDCLSAPVSLLIGYD